MFHVNHVYLSPTYRLAIGSNLGLAVVNTATNSCVRVLNSNPSIPREHCIANLCMAFNHNACTTVAGISDPKKYSTRPNNEDGMYKNQMIDMIQVQSSAGIKNCRSYPSHLNSYHEEEYQKVLGLRNHLFPLLQSELTSSNPSTSL